MKNITLYIYTFFAILLFCGCQDVIDVDLTTAPPKLVVEANIIWLKGTSGSIQKIKLSTTTSYYSNEFPVVAGATVTVKNSTNNVFTFTEINNTGEYVCNNFVPQLEEFYVLNIVVNGQTYQATEQLKSVAPITKIEQKNDAGLFGKDIEIKAFFNDPPNIDNYHLFNHSYQNEAVPFYYVDKDEFYQGNEFYSRSRSEDLVKGDKVQITHIGISKQGYNYLSILLEIAGSSGGGPFQSPPATVRGNVINKTNFDNYALGYFALAQADTKTYIVQ